MLTWRLPEHQSKPSDVGGYVFLRNVLAQVLIGHLPEHELNLVGGLRDGRGGPWDTMGRLGGPWGVHGGPRVAIGGVLEFLWGPCEGP